MLVPELLGVENKAGAGGEVQKYEGVTERGHRGQKFGVGRSVGVTRNREYGRGSEN